MTLTGPGSLRLFRFAGIQVYLHWSWFVIALIEIQNRSEQYSSYLWCALEYLALFGIVLLHEFGHSLACRSVGGRAERIVLWPLGGIAFVSPPPRPWATLWSIAAGPLVNVILAPLLTGLVFMAQGMNWPDAMPNAYRLAVAVCFMNYLLLVFNLLPIYPLDGGQILQSILWFFVGRARSLMAVAIIGFVGVAALAALAVILRSPWTGVMAAFVLLNCWHGLRAAQVLARVAELPRRPGYACPVCRQPPVLGNYWRCARCGQPFDTFETGAICPHCATSFAVTQCLDCGQARPFPEWLVAPPRI